MKQGGSPVVSSSKHNELSAPSSVYATNSSNSTTIVRAANKEGDAPKNDFVIIPSAVSCANQPGRQFNLTLPQAAL